MVELVCNDNGKATTTSNLVAEHFNKNHRHVLEKIDSLFQELTAEKLAVSSYFTEEHWINERNREYRRYKITRDGFALIAMGFTGKEALRFKTRYIKAFNAMEKELGRVYASRQVGIETRKVLTDHIEESGENKRMHGHGFSTYTKLAYKFAGIDYVKPPKGIKFRDTLKSDELSRVDNIEGMMKALIKTGKQYLEIKKDMETIFKPMNEILTKKTKKGSII